MERRRRARGLIACFLVLVSFRIADAQERSLDTDRAALERFKAAVDPTGTLLPWVSGTNPCTWTGIQCYQNRVAVLRLSGYNFEGAVPADMLADLDQLRVMSLHHNRFTGPFPVALVRCTLLRGLFLANNLFFGPLPNVTGLWPRLSHFDIGFNNFSGAIPDSFNTLRSLLALELPNNAFSGEIPPLTLSLLRFSVANNQLEGPVPLPLQSFPNSSFAGNIALCGPPTSILCPPASPPPIPPESPSVASPTSTPPTKPPSTMSAGAIAGVATGAFVVLIALTVFFLCCCCCCCCPRPRDDDDELDHSTPISNSNSLSGKQVAPYSGEHSAADSPLKPLPGLQFLDPRHRPEFVLEELLQASAEVLGKGSMGTSYKADMAESVVVVKRLKEVAAERREFEAQVTRLARLRHRHLMPLRAFFFTRDEKLLVTDFVARGSVSALLHGERLGDRPVLDWVSREKIALGSARALAYLHKPSVKIAHGNISSSNILVNRDYEPCLTDYGLTSLLNPASFAASRFVGYRAPEVSDIRQVSFQSDVYSFGVVLLELITGQAPRSNDKSETGVDLPRWIASIPRADWSDEAFDPELKKGNSCGEEMAQMLQLGVACVDRVPDRRPKMDELVLLLEDITQLDTSSGTLEARPSRSRSGGPTPKYTRPSSGIFVIE